MPHLLVVSFQEGIKMTKDGKPENTKTTFVNKNPWYPHHESDRADELIDELDEAQIMQLFRELKTKTFAQWNDWFEGAREEISKYDYLSRAQRKRRLRQQPDNATLRLHHACICVELWRARLNRRYLCLPPAGEIDTPESQREMLMAVVAAYNDFDLGDLWFFDHPDIDDPFPFQ
jgi:hypothetical protein